MKKSKRVLVTGSGGLVGSAVVRLFASRGWKVWGVDNDQRGVFFGHSVKPNIERLVRDCDGYRHWDFDIRQHGQWNRALAESRPSLIVHAAAQPSHDWAAGDPLSDFDINTAATVHILEAFRKECPEAFFVFLSTNKVYGTRPNRYEDDQGEPNRIETSNPIMEVERVDQTTHSLFGVSKLAADLYVQEYRRYFDLQTWCLRCGCITGADHQGAEQHGFLNYLFRCAAEGRRYTVYGHKGRQVRDNIHAADVALAIDAIARGGALEEHSGVFNLGGGRDNSCSVREAVMAAEARLGVTMDVKWDGPRRKGDHIAYVTDTARFRAIYPDWSITRTLADIFDELAQSVKGQ